MRIGDKRVFSNPQKLLSLIALRRAGYATTSLAILFNVDRTSVEHHLRKYHLRPDAEVYTLERIVSQMLASVVPPETPQWKTINGERYNLGKSYKDYLISMNLK